MQPAITPTQAQSIATLRSLRGPTLPILITMLVLRRPTHQSEIATLTGYSDKPINQALNYLAVLGYATRDHYRRWQLTPHAQLSLPVLAIPEVGEIPTSAPTTTAIIPTQEASDSEHDSASDSESGEAAVVGPPSRRISESTLILRSGGIGEPQRSRLAALPHVTPEYARAHVEKAKREKKPAGLLIHRIRHNDPAPDTRMWVATCRACSHVIRFDCACPVCRRCYNCCECDDASEGDHETGREAERDIHEAGNTNEASTALKETVLAQVCDAASPVTARGEEDARDVVRSRMVELARAMGRGPPRADTVPEAPSHRFDGRFLGRSAQQVQRPSGSQIPRTSASHQ